MDNSVDLSVVVPLHNEEGNVEVLCAALRAALDPTGRVYEVLLVNDGSTDGTAQKIERETESDSRFIELALPHNQGQVLAMAAGFARSRGRLVASLDADRQNDPADLPALMTDVEQGADAACGWRYPRFDPWWSKVLPSRIFNWLLRRLLGAKVHDASCTLRVYRGDAIRALRLTAADLSFIPLLLQRQGLTVVERIAQHHPRTAGETHYLGAGRFVTTLHRLWQLRREKSLLSQPLQ